MKQHHPIDPVPIGGVDISAAGERCIMRLGDINGDGRMEMVMIQADGGIDNRYVPHQVVCVTAFDLDGHMLWQIGKPDPDAGGPGSDYPAQIYDIDGDGHLEVICVMNKKFVILDGRSGQVKKTYELPDPEAHDCIIIANLTGQSYPQDIIVKDRYRRMWALDNDFNVLWSHEGNIGHFPWVYDFDGDGKDEVMAGYDFLDHDGTLQWSCRNLADHADCIFVGDVNDDGEPELVIGGSCTVMYDRHGNELWRNEDTVESQHIALGKFRDDLPGLQTAGLDRMIRGSRNKVGKDGMFLLDSAGKLVWMEDRETPGWLTIIETIRNWDEDGLDYILAYRRGGGITPTLYDGQMNSVVRFPVDGYVTYADLFGSGTEQVIIYSNDRASIYSSKNLERAMTQANMSRIRQPLAQPKRLYRSTLYPGGEV